MADALPLEDVTIRLLRARDAVGEAQNEMEALCERRGAAANGMEMLKYFHFKSDLGATYERLDAAYREALDKQVGSIP